MFMSWQSNSIGIHHKFTPVFNINSPNVTMILGSDCQSGIRFYNCTAIYEGISLHIKCYRSTTFDYGISFLSTLHNTTPNT